MAGLIGVGRNTLGQASVGFQKSADLEVNRNAAQQKLNAARAAQRSGTVVSGAGLGASVGVNNYMANAATQKGIESFGQRIGIDGISKLAAQEAATAAGTGSVTGSAGTGALFGVPSSGAPMSLAALEAGTAAGTAAGTGAGFTVSATGAPMALAGLEAGTTAGTGVVAGTGASTGALAGIGAIATPLLIGAGAALLLDSMFDIF